MVLSPALNIRSARGPIYDADALAFCRASGATARKAISDFVKGVKALGLWNSMVCWPLRSAQNAGVGDTVHSLGGLGTFNGTRVNGPAWGVNGLDFPETSPTPHVLTTFTPPSSEDFVIFAAFQCNPQGSLLNAICACRSAELFFSVFQSSDNFERSILWSVPNNIFPQTANRTDGSFNTSATRFNIASATKTVGLTRNTDAEIALSGAVTITATPPPLILGAETTTARPLSGSLPFVAYLRVSSFNNTAFRTLYKQTLGTGLGLP